MKVVIMAGGRGTRMLAATQETPKPMIPVAGMPVLEHELTCLQRQGITDIIIVVGYLGNVIMDYFGDGSRSSPATGRPFGISIQYFQEEEPLGTGGALFQLRDQLREDFLLLNADALFDVDFHRLMSFHQSANGLATILVHPNSHPFDSSLVVKDARGAVERWLTKEESGEGFHANCVNAGIQILSPELLKIPPAGKRVDLDREILKPLAGSGKLFACASSEYVKDMGTPQRYQEVCRDQASGMIQRRNLSRPQRAIFLDRDGTINRDTCFLKDIDDFELLPNAAKAIKRINESGYLAIVITNQPVIARGEVSVEQLREIHNKMETLLGREGAYVDAIYYCPHHPDRGFPGERPEYKIDCQCRKPKPGLLLRAAEEFHIDLSQSWMIGDSVKDVGAGKNAGCQTAYIGTAPDVLADKRARDLFCAVEEILRG